jgi:hypothetical protein
MGKLCYGNVKVNRAGQKRNQILNQIPFMKILTSELIYIKNCVVYLLYQKQLKFYVMVDTIKKTFSKEVIQDKLMTDSRWVERSLIKLYNRQTEDEQTSKETKWENGMGFNGSDSRYLTYCSQWVLSGRSLSGVHLTKCGTKLKKYWKQIQDEIVQHNSQR